MPPVSAFKRHTFIKYNNHDKIKNNKMSEMCSMNLVGDNKC
jgi:hypothetical protein